MNAQYLSSFSYRLIATTDLFTLRKLVLQL